MSFIYNNKIQYDDTQNLDAFGRLRVSQLTTVLEFKYMYDKLPLLVDELTNGVGATSNFVSSASSINMTVTSNGNYVIRQSKNRGVYQPGKSQLSEFTFSDFNIETNVIKIVGYYSTFTGSTFDSNYDGFFLESNGISNDISFNIYQSGVLILNSPVSAWTSTHFNPATIDWSKTQLMMVDFQWLGVGRVRFSMVFDGLPYTFVTNSGSNVLSEVYMKSPNQPIRYEIRSSGGTGTFNQICSQSSIEGGVNQLFYAVGINTNISFGVASTGVRFPVIGWKLGDLFTGVESMARGMAVLNETNDSYRVELIFNPVMSAPISYSALTNTPITYGVGNGIITTSGGTIMHTNFGIAGGTSVDNIPLTNNNIKPGVNINGSKDTVWLCITPLNNSSSYSAALNLEYFV